MTLDALIEPTGFSLIQTLVNGLVRIDDLGQISTSTSFLLSCLLGSAPECWHLLSPHSGAHAGGPGPV